MTKLLCFLRISSTLMNKIEWSSMSGELYEYALKRNVYVVQSVLTEDPADVRSNFDPLWILAVGDNDAEPQHCRYRRKSSLSLGHRLRAVNCFRHVSCCLPMNLFQFPGLVPRATPTSFPGPLLWWERTQRYVVKIYVVDQQKCLMFTELGG